MVGCLGGGDRLQAWLQASQRPHQAADIQTGLSELAGFCEIASITRDARIATKGEKQGRKDITNMSLTMGPTIHVLQPMHVSLSGSVAALKELWRATTCWKRGRAFAC